MTDSSAASLGRCTMLTGDEKKRLGPSLAPEASKSMAAEAKDSVDSAAAAAVEVKNKKWRVPQDQVDFILSLDVSYVLRSPDNIDNIPVSEEVKQRYRAAMLKSVALMREIRRSRMEMQEFVRAQLEEYGYVEIETNSEMYAKYKRELHEQGYVEIKTD
ncbi:unnamed protein product [Urochloa decumbens]|uniref:Uncharacterized protein n=1 Tax=Urochloa decumbens TaxID=240449 RepID=A0ABC9AJK5_9POAL